MYLDGQETGNTMSSRAIVDEIELTKLHWLFSNKSMHISHYVKYVLFLLYLLLTSINEPMPAGMRTSRLVFSSIRYKNIINVLTHLQITAKAKRKCR